MIDNLELLVPYKKDSDSRERNKKHFISYWQGWNVNIIEDYDTRAGAYNIAALNSSSEYIALADIDIKIPYHQMTVGAADVIYPYDHIINIDHNGTHMWKWKEYYIYGVMVIFKRESFLRFGGENEDFIGWGWEDLERYFRALNNGLTIKRIPGPAYHMDHGRHHEKTNEFCEHNWKIMNDERMKYEYKLFTKTG